MDKFRDIISTVSAEACKMFDLNEVSSFTFYVNQHSDGDYTIEMGEFYDLDENEIEDEEIEDVAIGIEEKILWEHLDFELMEELDLIGADIEVYISIP